jgi:hypothetical protein
MAEIVVQLTISSPGFAEKLATRLRIEPSEDPSRAILVTFHGIPPLTEQQ